ncbi:MAG: response regulator [Deltaproteobacteria bacterium]|nr:MAG: response regulator [Deltaproteobacteria bacterium]
MKAPGSGWRWCASWRGRSAATSRSPARSGSGRSSRPTSRARAAFVEEALRWTPDAPPPGGEQAWARSAQAPRIVWADDNADMREYVTRLLADHFEVIAVADGEQALQSVREQVPDLVLSDIMMPQLDGFGLLAALRADPRTQTVPVILLSARAGPEASTEGMDAGADDYLIKPFAARELVARVRTHVALGRTRRAWSAELERANHELVRANTELEAFTYSVSHDLRAPLRAITGFAQIVLEDDTLDDAGRREMLQTVCRNAQRMQAIINDLLTLSRASRGELRREPVNLSKIARQILDELHLRDPSRIIEVDVRDGMVATADGRLVAIALENLLGNAWKFTSKRPCAQIVMERDERGAFTVRDNGAGFDMAASDRLFEPFQRLHAGSEFEGTGIGLAIVRRIIERHGGRVSAQGVIDGGATVRFTLEPGDVAAASS